MWLLPGLLTLVVSSLGLDRRDTWAHWARIVLGLSCVSLEPEGVIARTTHACGAFPWAWPVGYRGALGEDPFARVLHIVRLGNPAQAIILTFPEVTSGEEAFFVPGQDIGLGVGLWFGVGLGFSKCIGVGLGIGSSHGHGAHESGDEGELHIGNGGESGSGSGLKVSAMGKQESVYWEWLGEIVG